MFFWKSKDGEKEERFSLSLLALLALFLPALLIISVGKLLFGRQNKAPDKTGQADRKTRASEKSFAAKGGKSPEKVKDRLRAGRREKP